MLAVRIDDDMGKRLGALAQRTHRSKSYLVRQAVEQFLEDQEDLLTALSILERGGPTYSLEEVLSELGLDEKDL